MHRAARSGGRLQAELSSVEGCSPTHPGCNRMSQVELNGVEGVARVRTLDWAVSLPPDPAAEAQPPAGGDGPAAPPGSTAAAVGAVAAPGAAAEPVNVDAAAAAGPLGGGAAEATRAGAERRGEVRRGADPFAWTVEERTELHSCSLVLAAGSNPMHMHAGTHTGIQPRLRPGCNPGCTQAVPRL